MSSDYRRRLQLSTQSQDEQKGLKKSVSCDSVFVRIYDMPQVEMFNSCTLIKTFLYKALQG